MALNADESLLKQLAGHRNLPEDLALDWACRASHDVRLILAARPNPSPQLAQLLSHDRAEDVRARAIASPKK